jgi:TonB family protein
VTPPEVRDYEVYERLGGGGMGEVYRAKSLRDGRIVAIKVESGGLSDVDGQFRGRFLRETRILEGLRHENLPEFWGAGELSDGRLFIAMEFLEGRPLSSFAGSKLETLIPLYVQCAQVLEAIHGAGIVHRDISPDNFFVVEVGGRSVVKLIDFGISRDLDATSDGLTQVGSFLGKAEFCSPEQTGLLRGQSAVDWRTDMYSFGLTIFVLSSGKIPFPGKSVTEQIRGRLAELPRVAFQDVSQPRLRRLLARMLRLHPEDRPQSYSLVVAELLRVQSELAASAASRLEATDRQRRREARRTRLAGTASASEPDRNKESKKSGETLAGPKRYLPSWALPVSATAFLITGIVVYLWEEYASSELVASHGPSSRVLLVAGALLGAGAIWRLSLRRSSPIQSESTSLPSVAAPTRPPEGIVTGEETVRVPSLASEERVVETGPRDLHAVPRAVRISDSRPGGARPFPLRSRSTAILIGLAALIAAVVFVFLRPAPEESLVDASAPAPPIQPSEPSEALETSSAAPVPEPSPLESSSTVSARSTQSGDFVASSSEKPQVEKPRRATSHRVEGPSEQTPAPVPTAVPEKRDEVSRLHPVHPGDLVGPGPGVEPPQLLGEIAVVAPASLRGRRLSWQLTVLVEVDENGHVIEQRIVGEEPIPPVKEAVLDAVRKANFAPATKDSIPVKMWHTLRLKVSF